MTSGKLQFQQIAVNWPRPTRLPLFVLTMNFEQLITKYSQLSGRSQADSASAVTAFIQILTDAIKEEDDIFTPTMTLKTRRTTPKPSPDGKERKPKTIGKIVIK
jgi:nucleoid DNA-binding protein